MSVVCGIEGETFPTLFLAINEDSIMKNKILKATLLLVAFVTTILSQTAMAGTNSPYIDKKQENQKGRIILGVRSGELTAKETWRLGKQQKKIYLKERRFKADGIFTPRERAVIHRDLLKSSGSIYKQKHDRQHWGTGSIRIKSPGVNKRERKQTKRIGQGVHSGELTQGEAARLGKQQTRIHHQERRFKSDGTFTKRERIKLHQSQNRASRNIYRAKHNNRLRH